jgi:hypothetical protein
MNIDATRLYEIHIKLFDDDHSLYLLKYLYKHSSPICYCVNISVTTHCGHHFCETCLIQCTSCPLCNYKLKTSTYKNCYYILDPDFTVYMEEID